MRILALWLKEWFQCRLKWLTYLPKFKVSSYFKYSMKQPFSKCGVSTFLEFPSILIEKEYTELLETIELLKTIVKLIISPLQVLQEDLKGCGVLVFLPII